MKIMKRIYIISVFLLAFTLQLFATPEAEYKKLSKTYILNSDGSQEFRYSMELTLFTHAAMNRTYGESFIVYNPEFQELKIHTSYTKQKDGNIIRTPENAFVEVLPRQAANAPAFNHLKEMVIVHTGLELGATIYLDYSIISKPGYLPGLDIRDAIAQLSPVKDYTITVRVPEDKPLFYELSNYASKPTVSSVIVEKRVATDKVVWKEVVWKLKNMPAAPRTPQTTVLGGDVPILTVSGFASNDEALKYFGKQANGGASIQALAKTITMGKETDMEKLYAILYYVIDELDICRLSFAETGYRLRTLDEVVASAYGTETEKINLLASLLNEAGISTEIVAAYLNNANINSCGLSAIDELFVNTKVGNKQFLLTPKQKKMSEAGWYADYAKFVSISNPGNDVKIELPSTEIDYSYTINMEQEKAEMQVEAKVGASFFPYTDYTSTYTARDKDGKEEHGKGFSKFTYSTSQNFKDIDEYIIFSLPDSPNSLSHASYIYYNSNRNENLLLPYKAKESYKYIINLPDNMELKTPVSVKTINGKAGTISMSVKQNGKTIEVIRTLEIKKQLISPAEYDDFRSIINEWAGNNQLLFFVAKSL